MARTTSLDVRDTNMPCPAASLPRANKWHVQVGLPHSGGHSPWLLSLRIWLRSGHSAKLVGYAWHVRTVLDVAPRWTQRFQSKMWCPWNRLSRCVGSGDWRLPERERSNTVFSLMRTQGSYFFSVPLTCVTNGDCAIIGDWAIIFSGRQFDIFCYISAIQMLRNVRCTHHTLGICRHMNSCHAPRPCTLYNTIVYFIIYWYQYVWT